MITESASNFDNLEQKSTKELLEGINKEDHTVPEAIAKVIPAIEQVVDQIVDRMKSEGRLFYIGAGTSGRLGVVDASEIPPTYGMDHGKVIGLIAGGDRAIRKAVEFAEDSTTQAWEDLKQHNISDKDFLIGIAASGRTPYVIGGVNDAKKNGIGTACITCNKDSELAKSVQFPIEVIVGPEFVTGSTRMKAGTAQKLVLNMISTTVMIKLGRVKGNKMIDMQLSNNKLVDRGVRMIMDELGVDENKAKELLNTHGNVRQVLSKY
ncbi:MAG: N-acetylmuramic acid 6-phosphate etherase [bacterium]|nr:N-acetylmuramic acid 6-phosphate etherase [bacterium]